MGSKQSVLTIAAIVVGFLLGIPATSHVGSLMWGDSPYSESSLMWTMDNSGRSRFSDYGGPMLRLGCSFAFMLSMIPTARGCAAVGRNKGSSYLVPATVCAVVFAAGYLWWRYAYV